MPFQPILPTWLALNACNDTSASGFTDLRTGLPVNAGGLNLGDYFDLTESEANALSYSTNGTLHAGRYRRVQVDSGATAGNVKTGTIGCMVAATAPNFNVVTSYDYNTADNPLHQVVFLNTVTPGNFCFVQELGVATVLGASSISSTVVGAIMVGTTNGLVTSSATITANTVGFAAENAKVSGLFKIILDLPAVQG